MNKKSVIIFIVVNVLAIIYLTLILIDFPTGFSKEFMFITPDSKEYLSTGQSFFNESVQDFLNIRPFLFPVFLGLVYSVGGYVLWFIFQVVMWLATVNLLFASLRKLNVPLVLNIIGILFFCANFSVIAMLFHGLTEVTVIFLLSCLIYIIASSINGFFSLLSLKKELFLLVLLTVVKPLFLLPTLAFFGLLIFVHFKTLFRKPKEILLIAIIILPIFVQVGLVKITHDKATFSEISTITYRRYLFTQLYQYNYSCERDTALIAVELMNPKEISAISKKQLSVLFDLYQDNLEINLNGYPVFLELSKSAKSKYFVDKMVDYNEWLYYFYQIGIYWAVLFFLHVLYRKRFLQYAGILFLGVLMYYIYLSSGISAYQGDRLVIVALPVSIVFYVYIVSYMYFESKSIIESIISKRRK